MQRKGIISAAVLVVAVLGVLGSRTAFGIDKYFTDFTGDHKWSNDANWKSACSGGEDRSKPVPGDRAIICADKVCWVDIADAVTGSFEVQAGHQGITRLIIRVNADLKIDSNSSIAERVTVELEQIQKRACAGSAHARIGSRNTGRCCDGGVRDGPATACVGGL